MLYLSGRVLRGTPTVVTLYVMYIRRECILFIFLNKNVYASRGVYLRSVLTALASEGGKGAASTSYERCRSCETGEERAAGTEADAKHWLLILKFIFFSLPLL